MTNSSAPTYLTSYQQHTYTMMAARTTLVIDITGEASDTDEDMDVALERAVTDLKAAQDTIRELREEAAAWKHKARRLSEILKTAEKSQAEMRQLLDAPPGEICPETSLGDTLHDVSEEIVEQETSPIRPLSFRDTSRAREAQKKTGARKPGALRAKYLKPNQLPPADFSLVKLLDSGRAGDPAAQHLDVLRVLGEYHRNRLEQLWNFFKARKLFDNWFAGGMAGRKCLNSYTFRGRRGKFTHGSNFACDACVKSTKKWPCCRVALDRTRKHVVVVVLPEYGKSGAARWGYCIPGYVNEED